MQLVYEKRRLGNCAVEQKKINGWKKILLKKTENTYTPTDADQPLIVFNERMTSWKQQHIPGWRGLRGVDLL